MKNNIIVVIVLLLVAMLASLVYFRSQRPQVPQPAPSPQTSADRTVNSTTTSSSSGEIDKLKAGGSSYRDPNGVFVFLYPNDYKLDVQNNGQQVRIYKAGPTQKGQTEMYDGVIIVIEPIHLSGQTLNQWLDTRIKESTADGTSELVRAKKATTLNNYSGFNYSLRGLGTSDYLVVQKSPSSVNAISITSSISDPAQQGFQGEVSSILSTIELLK